MSGVLGGLAKGIAIKEMELVNSSFKRKLIKLKELKENDDLRLDVGVLGKIVEYKELFSVGVLTIEEFQKKDGILDSILYEYEEDE